ncbi:MAG: CoA protein activase [Syntrophomonadaceae bacterium]|nr:CoA protein activase [Syntrophomonadaceae bacterium]
MRVTFPHMGNAWIAIKCLFEGLKLEVVVPPPCTRKTMELGVRYSPEFACLPLKINIGNYIEALEMGADTIVTAGGWGPCRFGYYAQVQRDILKDLGYQFDLVVLEAPDSRLTELLGQVKSLGDRVSYFEITRAVRLAWNKLKAVDEVEEGLRYFLPRVTDRHRAENIFRQGLEDIDAASNRKEIEAAVNTARSEFNRLATCGEAPVRIGLVGEVYTLLEPSSNCEIERKLGYLGAEVRRSVSLPQWVNDHLLGGILRVASCKDAIGCAAPYLNDWVGGHGQETVGYSVKLARAGYDGIIQIGPLTCMPEIVAQSILGKVSEVEGVPVMTMYFDEQSGEAGVLTRLEAFLDMVRRRKRVAAAGAHRPS